MPILVCEKGKKRKWDAVYYQSKRSRTVSGRASKEKIAMNRFKGNNDRGECKVEEEVWPSNFTGWPRYGRRNGKGE